MNLDKLLLYKEDARDRVFLAIIRALLRQGNRPCTPRELSNIILKNNLATLGGSTPYATVSSRISQHLRRAKRLGRDPLLGRKLQDGTNARRMVYYVRENTSGVHIPGSPTQDKTQDLGKVSTVLFSMLASGDVPCDVAAKIYGSRNKKHMPRDTKEAPVVSRRSLRGTFLVRSKRKKSSGHARKKRIYMHDMGCESTISSGDDSAIRANGFSPVSDYSLEVGNSYPQMDLDSRRDRSRRDSYRHNSLMRTGLGCDTLPPISNNPFGTALEENPTSSSTHDLSDLNFFMESDDNLPMFDRRMNINDSLISHLTDDDNFQKENSNSLYTLRRLILDPDCKYPAGGMDSAYASSDQSIHFLPGHLTSIDLSMFLSEGASDVPSDTAFINSSNDPVLDIDPDFSNIPSPLNDGIVDSDHSPISLPLINTSGFVQESRECTKSPRETQHLPQIDEPGGQPSLDVESDSSKFPDPPVGRLDYVLSDPRFVSYRSLFGNVFSVYESSALFGIVSVNNDTSSSITSEDGSPSKTAGDDNTTRPKLPRPHDQCSSNLSITVTSLSHVAQIAIVAHAPTVVLPLSYVLVSKTGMRRYAKKHPACTPHTHVSVNLAGYVRARELVLCAHLSQRRNNGPPHAPADQRVPSGQASNPPVQGDDAPNKEEQQSDPLGRSPPEYSKEALEVYKGELMSWALRASFSHQSFAVCVIDEDESEINKGFVLVGLSSSTTCLDASAEIPTECQGVWIPSIDAVKVEPSFVDFIATVESTYNVSTNESGALNAEFSDLSFAISGKNIVPVDYDRPPGALSIRNTASAPVGGSGAYLAQRIGFSNDPFRPGDLNLLDDYLSGTSCNIMIRKCPKGGFYFRSSDVHSKGIPTLESSMKISCTSDYTGSITGSSGYCPELENKRSESGKESPQKKDENDAVVPLRADNAEDHEQGDTISEEARMLLPSKCVRDIGFILSLNPAKQIIPDIESSDIYVSLMDGVPVYVIWVDMFSPSSGSVAFQPPSFRALESSSNPSKRRRTGSSRHSAQRIPLASARSCVSQPDGVDLVIEHRCRPKKSCSKLIRPVCIPDSSQSPSCIPVMRRIDNDMISAMPFLYSLGLKSEVGRNVALSPEPGLICHKKKNSPLYGVWVPLRSARNLAEIFGSNPRLSSILSDSLCEFSPMMMQALECYSGLYALS